MLVVDSFSYFDRRVQSRDVLVGCSFAGASTTSTVLPLGPKAMIGDGLSTWRDGSASAANGLARDQGNIVGMEAGEALARMAATHAQP